MTPSLFSFRRQIKSFSMSSLVVCLVLGFSVTSAYAAIAESTFDTDADGWTGLACTNPGGLCLLGNSPLGAKFKYEATGGNPGGWISGEDPDSDNTARFIAPSKFQNNLNLANSEIVSDRRFLSFDIQAIDVDGTGFFDAPVSPVVTIEGAGKALVYFVPVPAIGVWTSYNVPLYKEAGDTGLLDGWDLFNGTTFVDAVAADFTSFGAVTRLTIIGEWLKDVSDLDIGGLDNVQLNAVPIPAAAWLFGSGLLALIGYSRRKRTT